MSGRVAVTATMQLGAYRAQEGPLTVSTHMLPDLDCITCHCGSRIEEEEKQPGQTVFYRCPKCDCRYTLLPSVSKHHCVFSRSYRCGVYADGGKSFLLTACNRCGRLISNAGFASYRHEQACRRQYEGTKKPCTSSSPSA